MLKSFLMWIFFECFSSYYIVLYSEIFGYRRGMYIDPVIYKIKLCFFVRHKYEENY